MKAAPPLHDRMLRVRGTVQGVGFRPFVLRTASALGIRGWVRNDAQVILIRALGTPSQLENLAAQVVGAAPMSARVASAEWLDDAPDKRWPRGPQPWSRRSTQSAPVASWRSKAWTDST